MQENSNVESRESFFKETLRFALITLAIVLPIRLFIAEPFIVNGASMEPTFESGDYLIVDRLSYKLEEPSRGDVVIFRYPKDPKKYFIKRIIGLPGETINMDKGTISITKDNKTETIVSEPYISRATNDVFTTVLGKDEFFVLGDNRPQSSDSRMWGTLPRENLVGRAFFRLYPVTNINILPGQYNVSLQ